MSNYVTDAIGLIGFISLGWGVYAAFGEPASAIVCGVLMVAYAVKAQ